MAEGETLLALTTLSFDIAGLELWLPQLVGGTVYLAGREEAADGKLLEAALLRSRATLLQATPSTWRTLFAAGWSGDPKLKALVGGEALPPDLAQRLADTCGEAWNLYGPTETTIWSTCWRIPRGAAGVRIGAPIANTQVHVLDEAGRPLPPGVTGELLIGGEGVARGYLRRPELTAERFVADPFRGGGARMYRTGDLARWLPDGTLDFLGRNDAQLKLRGHRIEPGEIEAALLQLPEVAEAAVALHHPESGGDPRLVALVVPRPRASLPPSAELRARLRRVLLEHMLPMHFLAVESLPLTPNGKLDRKRLAGLYRPPPEAPPPPDPLLSPLESELAAEFEALLGRRVVADTDFFEAGGDSVSALRLVGRLSRRYRAGLTGADLFLHSTPRRLGARLEELATSGATQATRHLVVLRAGGLGTPLFFCHPVGGQLVNYARLSLHLDRQFPLYGLQARFELPYDSLAARASAYVQEIVDARPEGPLAFCGYSLGGLLAVEIAAQLRRGGREVAGTFLLDSWLPEPPRTGRAKLSYRLAELRRFSNAERLLWLRAQLRRMTGKPDGNGSLEEALALDHESMSRLSDQALRWTPPAYDRRLVLFSAELDLRGYSKPPGNRGWDRRYSQLELVRLQCDHSSMVAEPHAIALAHDLERRLQSSGG